MFRNGHIFLQKVVSFAWIGLPDRNVAHLGALSNGSCDNGNSLRIRPSKFWFGTGRPSFGCGMEHPPFPQAVRDEKPSGRVVLGKLKPRPPYDSGLATANETP